MTNRERIAEEISWLVLEDVSDRQRVIVDFILAERKKAFEEAVEIAEDGQSSTKSLIAFDDNGTPNAYNTCLKIAEAIRKRASEK